MLKTFYNGFTLTELLISLSILGVIAIFIIPKILIAQQNNRNNAIAKEAAGMLAGAFSSYKLNYQSVTTMYPSDLFTALNYVKSDSSSTIDAEQTQANSTCTSPGAPCVKLHSGAMVMAWDVCGHFGGGNTTNAVYYQIDPDGIVTDGTTNGPGKSLVFALYYSGRISTYGTLATGTTSQTCALSATANRDPSWFSW
jgi:prepilin-type N-terminal cleavage/methylation domain-containing protein